MPWPRQIAKFFNIILHRAVAQRWEALEAVARADTAESTGTQMLSDLAEKLRQGFALEKTGRCPVGYNDFKMTVRQEFWIENYF